MRNMVEHGQISGSSDTTVLSGRLVRRGAARGGSRCRRRWPSPAGAASTARMMKSVEPTWSASVAHLVRALGVGDDDAVGVLGPEGLDVLGAEALVHRAVALPQQERGLLDSRPRSGRRARGGGSTPACRRGRSPWPGRCCGPRCWSGKNSTCRRRRRRRPRAEAPTRARPGRWSRCTPRRRGAPTNAFSAADEFM